jgi:DNA repair protein RadD
VKFQANEEDRELAAEVLKQWLDFDVDAKKAGGILRKILDRLLPGVESMYAGLSHGIDPAFAVVRDDKLPKLVIDLLQIDLLKDRSARRILLKSMEETDPSNPLFERGYSEERVGEENVGSNDLISGPRYTADELAERSWISGGPWARQFTKAFGFPEIFAGIRKPPEALPIEELEGPVDMPTLEDFQENLTQQVLDLLKQENGKNNRAIVRLPTGAGKTRVMVEALIDFWKVKGEGIKYLLWIAQTDELCEQALESFRQLWAFKGTRHEHLKVFRFWGPGRRLPTLAESGIIIAGISKLFQDTKEDHTGEGFQSELKSLSKYIGAVVVDEAHRSITAMYNSMFRALGIRFPATSERQIPLIGLTATPYRGYNEAETDYLLNKYNRNVLNPRGQNFPEQIWDDFDQIKKELTGRGILSRPIRETLETHIDFQMEEDEARAFEEWNILKPKFLNRLGHNYSRNKLVFDRLVNLSEKQSSILYFGTSVNNANVMNALLGDKGIPSAVISAETDSGSRQFYIKKFKDQKLRVLCNYGVLTTGFDAPKIDAILIARPTESPTLYEQMIGRGLRGRRFGGTDECLIVDTIDNIYFHSRAGSPKFVDGSHNYWHAMGKGDHLTKE